jgi:hypothetical protein
LAFPRLLKAATLPAEAWQINLTSLYRGAVAVPRDIVQGIWTD